MNPKPKKLVFEKFKISKIKSSHLIKGGNDTYVDENTVPITDTQTCSSLTVTLIDSKKPSCVCPPTG